MINIMKTGNFEKKDFIWLTSYIPSLRKTREGAKTGNLKDRPESVHKECYLLACPLDCSATFPIQLRPICLKKVPPTVGMVLLMSSNVQ